MLTKKLHIDGLLVDTVEKSGEPYKKRKCEYYNFICYIRLNINSCRHECLLIYFKNKYQLLHTKEN